MNRQQANLEILNILGKYLLDNPYIRFGQALSNLGIVDVGTPMHEIRPTWINGFYEESVETLERVKKETAK